MRFRRTWTPSPALVVAIKRFRTKWFSLSPTSDRPQNYKNTDIINNRNEIGCRKMHFGCPSLCVRCNICCRAREWCIKCKRQSGWVINTFIGVSHLTVRSSVWRFSNAMHCWHVSLCCFLLADRTHTHTHTRTDTSHSRYLFALCTRCSHLHCFLSALGLHRIALCMHLTARHTSHSHSSLPPIIPFSLVTVAVVLFCPWPIAVIPCYCIFYFDVLFLTLQSTHFPHHKSIDSHLSAGLRVGCFYPSQSLHPSIVYHARSFVGCCTLVRAILDHVFVLILGYLKCHLTVEIVSLWQDQMHHSTPISATHICHISFHAFVRISHFSVGCSRISIIIIIIKWIIRVFRAWTKWDTATLAAATATRSHLIVQKSK